MIRPRNQAANERTRQFLEDLEAVRENLLALSADVWHSKTREDGASNCLADSYGRIKNPIKKSLDRIREKS